MTTYNNNFDITKLAYQNINFKYSKAKYLDIECIMDNTTGYINATKFCSSVSDQTKRFDNYIANARYKNLFKYLNESPEYSGGSISILIKDNTSSNELRGTYVHHILLLDIASWISPEAYFKASRIVNNFLVREREEEIRKLTGDKCKLVKMLEASDKRREEAEKRAEAMLLKMTLQNEKTHDKLDKTQDKLDKTHIKLDKTKVTLKRIETRVEKIVKEVVPPAKQISLHEQFGIMKLFDSEGKRDYKVYCTQKRCVAKAKNSILKIYPKAELIKEIKPNPNAKNFLHTLKEKYGSGKKSKIKVSYNFINLVGNVTEEELINMVEEVVNDTQNFGSDEE
jgi:hypothetical protein